MRNGPKLLALVLALAWSGCDAPAPEPPTVSLEGGSLCADPTATCAQAAGLAEHQVGELRILHKRTPGQTLVSLRIYFRHGGRDAYQSWAEHLALDVFRFALGRQHDISEWRRRFEALGATVSIADAADYASVSLLAPVPRFDEALRLLELALDAPTTSDDYLAWSKYTAEVEADEVAGDPESAASARALVMLGPASTRTTQLPQNLRVMDGITVPDLERAWRSLRSRTRVRVVVVGDVDVAQVTRVLAPRWQALPPATERWPMVESPPAVAERVAILPLPGSPTWHVVSYVAGPAPGSADDAAFRLGVSILHRRLFASVREQRALAYSVAATPFLGRESFASISLTTAQPEPALASVRQTIAELLATAPSEAELSAARASIETSLSLQSSTPLQLTAALGWWLMTAEDPAGSDVLRQQLRTASVEQVHTALRTYLRAAATAAAGGGAELRVDMLEGLLPR